MKVFVTYLYILIISLLALIIFPIACIVYLFSITSKRKIVLHKLTTFWSLLYLKALPGCKKISVSGTEYLNKKKKYIFVSNHQSALDIMMAYHINFHFKWVAKSEVFKIPFIGWNMTLNNYIPLKRGDRSGIKKMMADCSKHLKNHNSVYIFPEGTRSKNSELGKFKQGAFTLAKEHKTDIMPIIIKNTNKVYDKKGFLMNGVHLELQILPSINFQSFQEKTIKQLTEEVQELFTNKLDNIN